MNGVNRNIVFVFCILTFALNTHAQSTEKVYLSGMGSDDAVNWDFFCTGGMNADKWTKIAVPSCWELQGFGKYDYGFAKDSVRGKEKGLYKHSFNVPSSWKGKTINIVFEGVMTDAEVKVNGKVAGPVHQGAFYAFKYDITGLLKYGSNNLLEVSVAKHSANASVNAAERQADFWIFGGIFRPVWIEVLPATHFENISIDAKGDGHFTASIKTDGSPALFEVAADILDKNGQTIKRLNAKNVNLTSSWNVFLIQDSIISVQPWSPESPTLYSAVFKITYQGRTLHAVTEKFGFRTIEVRQRDGIYVNGVKVKMKGVNRHSFRPETGRTLSKKNSIEDVLLIKDMNMNAVRMSHYPPDDHFLDVCDSLGLFVMDELAGWHGHYDTPTGIKLVKEMMDHDENHPSIIMWANGNEGGHNFDLDSLFIQYDIQKRPVVHPWQLFDGIETQHYREYNYGIGNYEYGKEIVMPTEFLHGQFDGGHGAGLEDYWEKMWHDPLSAGGFLWDFADNAVLRKDKHDSLDTDKHRAADGILGPHYEKEGSYYAIKEIWSPVHIEHREISRSFDGKLTLENQYYFTNLNQCSFSWQLKNLKDSSSVSGTAPSPDVQPLQKGQLYLPLPKDWSKYDVLHVTVKDKFKRELFTWSYPIQPPLIYNGDMLYNPRKSKINLTEQDSVLNIGVADVMMSFNKNNGQLLQARNAKGVLPFNNGPVIQEGVNNFKGIKYEMVGDNLEIYSHFDKKESYNTIQWTIFPNGLAKLQVSYFPAAYFTNFVGINFSLPEKEIRSVAYTGYGPYRVWKNRMKGNKFGVWTKEYNQTETGEYPWIYPEFKGYYKDFYRAKFTTSNNSFTVATETESVFLRLYSAAWKTDQWHNYEPLFPSGDISFMQGISSIGTKTQRNETTGPMGMKNIFYDYEKDPSRALKLVLYFDFSGN